MGNLSFYIKNDLWLIPDDPCMTFDPGNVLRSVQGFFLPNLVAIGNLEQFDPWLTPADLCMTFDPINALHFGQGSTNQIWLP